MESSSGKTFGRPEPISATVVEAFEPPLATHEDLRVGEPLMSVKREIEFSMSAIDMETTAQSMREGNPRSAGNIIGVGVGTAKRDLDQISPEGPGAPTINIYVASNASQEEVRRALADEFGQRAFNEDRRALNIISCGIIEAQQHMFTARPAPCGVSIGNAGERDAGTLGFLARGRGERRDRLLAVTNNHVIARLNDGGAGEDVCQPGRFDDPAGSKIGTLERYVKLDFTGKDNFVDCASAWVDPDLVRPEHVYVASGQQQLFAVSGEALPATQNLVVGKSGRTTGLTVGRVFDLAATINVRFSGKVARFRDVLAITGIDGKAFSEGGDSGSLVWSHDADRRPVGLHFAGGTHQNAPASFSIPIGRVCDALDVDIYVG